jgi:hypothetical protein
MSKCQLRRSKLPGDIDAKPLTEPEALAYLGIYHTQRDVDHAQKLFTCVHGVTLNFREARARLGLPRGRQHGEVASI